MIEKYTALYSDLDIEYAQVMSGPYEDLSYKGEDAVLIAGHKDGKITGFWRPMVAFGDEVKLKMLIEDLWSVSQDIYYQDFLIDGKLSVISQFLLRHGYKARPYYTQVIDLTKTEEELHADLRKSYKSLVNKKKDSVHFYFCSSGWAKAMKDIHDECTKPRAPKSWDIQEKMIIKGEAMPLLAQDAYILIYFNKSHSYYASGRSLNSDTHPMIWKIVKTAKWIGIKYFEMGEQVFAGDPKLVNISKFKRGFGGKTITRLNLTKD